MGKKGNIIPGVESDYFTVSLEALNWKKVNLLLNKDKS